METKDWSFSTELGFFYTFSWYIFLYIVDHRLFFCHPHVYGMYDLFLQQVDMVSTRFGNPPDTNELVDS